MKKLIAFLATLTISLTAFSQKDTDTIPVKYFPIPVVKTIVKDLLSGDSAKAQLSLCDLQVEQLEKKVELKDSVISTMKSKEINFKKIIETQDQKFVLLENYTKKIEFDLKKEKVKNKFKSFISVGIVGALTFFLITK
jgi:hypothetical protein